MKRKQLDKHPEQGFYNNRQLTNITRKNRFYYVGLANILTLYTQMASQDIHL